MAAAMDNECALSFLDMATREYTCHTWHALQTCSVCSVRSVLQFLQELLNMSPGRNSGRTASTIFREFREFLRNAFHKDGQLTVANCVCARAGSLMNWANECGVSLIPAVHEW